MTPPSPKQKVEEEEEEEEMVPVVLLMYSLASPLKPSPSPCASLPAASIVESLHFSILTQFLRVLVDDFLSRQFLSPALRKPGKVAAAWAPGTE